MTQRRTRKNTASNTWYKLDLHLHTPASADYQERGITYLDILQQAELRGLDVLAFTDHNTVRGYSQMLSEIDNLSFLAQRDRAQPEELRRLAEYRRLLEKILILPGFEFTATFGFHILGIFPPQTPVRQLEHILLTLNVPMSVLDAGSSNVGASADVLTAYRVIREGGGLAIAAHVNSANGVAMKGLDFGGQTRIAYTQDPNLHALEVTDLDKRGRFATAKFFDGTKPGYPRRMHCLQGSDAHRLVGSDKGRDFGVGERVTEAALPEKSFEALKALLEGDDFNRLRPYKVVKESQDYVRLAREAGPGPAQSFHLSLAQKGGHLDQILEDICAFSNQNGGTLWIGVSPDPQVEVAGLARATAAMESLYAECEQRISPPPDVEIDILLSQQKSVMRVQVNKGPQAPYAIEGYKFYLRREQSTYLALRDDIVNLILGQPPKEFAPTAAPLALPAERPPAPRPQQGKEDGSPLRGVEVVGTERRRGTFYHILRDLRNNDLVHNVTRYSARRLWYYAILQIEERTFSDEDITWQGDYGLIRRYHASGATRYDLAQRSTDQTGKKITRYYFGVTEEGMLDHWTQFISPEAFPDEGLEELGDY